MGWLGRLIGKDRPVIPAGGQPTVVRANSDVPTKWRVRIRMPGVPDEKGKAIGPVFDELEVADQYRAWCAGEAPTFTYPEGRA